jgi:hypothetical protein
MKSMPEFGLPAETRLAASGFRREKLDQERSIIYLLDPSLRIVYCNRAWDEFALENGGEKLIGARIHGITLLDVLPEPLRTY